MTESEKAKAYDKAINRASGFRTQELKDVAAYIFPELAESEDEKIRKTLISYFKGSIGLGVAINGVSVKDIVAWLEKQGEKTVVIPKFRVGDVIKNIKNGDTVKVVEILNDSYCYSGWDGAATIHSDFFISDQDGWELVEQKPVDVRTTGYWNVQDVEQKPVEIINGNLKKWCHDDDIIFDAAKMIIEDSPRKSYGGVHKKEIVPWIEFLKDRIISLCALVEEINRKLKQKPVEWSEEDEKMINDTIQYIVTSWTDKGKSHLISWLKSLRPQPKMKWNVEDAINLDLIYNALNQVYGLEENKRLSKWISIISYIPHWKPSEEQINALSITVKHGCTDDKEALGELLEQLKAL